MYPTINVELHLIFYKENEPLAETSNLYLYFFKVFWK